MDLHITTNIVDVHVFDPLDVTDRANDPANVLLNLVIGAMMLEFLLGLLCCQLCRSLAIFRVIGKRVARNTRSAACEGIRNCST